MQNQISLMNLFELGTHRGNSKSQSSAKLKSRIHSYRHGISIINLVDTIDRIELCSDFLYQIGKKNKQILLVGTSKHVRDWLPKLSVEYTPSPLPYIDRRWLGGTLTNWLTIKKTLKHLEKFEKIKENVNFFKGLARNEQLNINKEIERTSKFFAGLKTLKSNKPGAILILDINNNPIAVEEAELMNIPIIGLTNTKAKVLPTNLDKLIVCNNNSVKSVEFIIEKLLSSYQKGLNEKIEVKTEAKTLKPNIK
jgi:small subunit ribosomal protein S2